jgi:hypothetical protein
MAKQAFSPQSRLALLAFSPVFQIVRVSLNAEGIYQKQIL